ncbi:hypothetical protein AVEN_129711-1 [Araneus ventricosus]|uniref:Uncharacterized protein n=1 Tax=Araneus ventricosus TaxID=182803 RepID=A0A4Y2DJQ0_ARAVE|nr:hypothetical protein AVEN_129711-1 [Araneus ventricosus]
MPQLESVSDCLLTCLVTDDTMSETADTNALRSAYYRPDFLAFILIGIDGNETAEQLAKDDRLLNNDSTYHISLFDTDAVAKSKLRKTSIKKSFQICKINEDRNITKTITRLRTSHFKGMGKDVNGVRTYVQSSHGPENELSPKSHL